MLLSEGGVYLQLGIAAIIADSADDTSLLVASPDVEGIALITSDFALEMADSTLVNLVFMFEVNVLRAVTILAKPVVRVVLSVFKVVRISSNL